MSRLGGKYYVIGTVRQTHKKILQAKDSSLLKVINLLVAHFQTTYILYAAVKNYYSKKKNYISI